MNRDKALALFDRLQEGRLAFLRHRGISVGPDGGQVARRVEDQRVERGEVGLVEERAILRKRELEVVLFPELLEHLLGERGIAGGALDDGVLEARGLREKQDLL